MMQTGIVRFPLHNDIPGLPPKQRVVLIDVPMAPNEEVFRNRYEHLIRPREQSVQEFKFMLNVRFLTSQDANLMEFIGSRLPGTFKSVTFYLAGDFDPNKSQIIEEVVSAFMTKRTPMEVYLYAQGNMFASTRRESDFNAALRGCTANPNIVGIYVDGEYSMFEWNTIVEFVAATRFSLNDMQFKFGEIRNIDTTTTPAHVNTVHGEELMLYTFVKNAYTIPSLLKLFPSFKDCAVNIIGTGRGLVHALTDRVTQLQVYRKLVVSNSLFGGRPETIVDREIVLDRFKHMKSLQKLILGLTLVAK
jgi:hypothetical protein